MAVIGSGNTGSDPASKPSGGSGIPVDATGGPTVDPTKNVLDLVDGAMKRQDDLRNADNRRQDDLRSAEARCAEELRRINTEHQREINELRNQLTLAESKRIDAIRAVDVAAVATASERAAQQANVLASQLATSTETLRNSAAVQATAIAQQLQNTIQPLTDRISLLEKSQYENKGKSGVTDPAMDLLIREVRDLAAKNSTTTGQSQGIGLSWGVLVAAVGMVIGIAGMVFAVMRSTGH